MRQYQICNAEKKELRKVICNKCKKEIEIIDGIAKEEVMTVEKRWGYFSNKDNEVHHFDLYEACYDELVQSFEVPVEIE